MSFTPEKTAESAMNSASNASAISRASVVLPTPGGPHRIIEWGLRASNASRSGLPAPSRWLWPTTSSSVRGRRRSASGAAGSRLRKRSSFTDNVGAFGWAELEAFGRDLRVALKLAELDDGGLAELVVELHRFETALAHAEADALERRILRARRRFEPVEPAFGSGGFQRVDLLDLIAAGEERRGTRAKRAVELAHGHLVEILVIDPEARAVAHDRLLVRLVVL